MELEGRTIERVVRANKDGVDQSEMVIEGKSWGWVDTGLAEILEAINAAGYVSSQSCSGLEMDHQDKQQTGGGYIAWFAEDLDEGQIEAIRTAAVAAQLTFNRHELFFMPGVAVRADRLADGVDEEEVRKEASAATNKEWGISTWPTGDEFMKWIKRREELRREGMEAHGGYLITTDDDMSTAWEAFADALLNS